MQAVVALCHFCENHGPRVVMTCQPMRDLDCVGEVCAPFSSLSPSTSSAPDGPVLPILQIECDGELSNRPRSNEGLPSHYGNCTRLAVDTEDRCKACTSFGNGPCLLSNDHPTRTSYVSSQVALQERVYDIVKNACLRSLSCEVWAAPKKKDGTTSSSSSQASPSQPSTSRCSTPSRRRDNSMSEGGYAMRLTQKTMAISIGGANHIGGGLNACGEPATDIIIAAEEEDGYCIFGGAENGYTLAFIFRLADAKARGFLRLFSLVLVSNDLTFITNNIHHFKNALGSVKTNLQTLAASTYERETRNGERAGDDDVMHPTYASVANRMPQGWFKRKIAIDTDRNLETITDCDDIWNTLHRQMMWTLRSPSLTCHDQVMEGLPSQDLMVLMELDESAIVELELHHPNQHAVSMNQLKNLKWIACQLDANGDAKDLDLLIRQVVTGGQVVIESRDKSLCRQFLLAISNLLPIGCLKLATYKEQYLPEFSSMFNLIGGPVGMDVPLEVSDVMVLRISSRDIVYGDENVSLHDCHINVLRRPEKEHNMSNPHIVKRYKELLLDTEVSGTVLETTLRTTRELWMSKAKICYQMRNQNTNGDIFRYIKGATVEDEQVILFWQAGLSKAYKSHVLATIENPASHNVLPH